MCFLVGSLPNGLVFRHELAHRRSTIGRLGISTILLEEESVSALHAELIAVGDRKYLLRDLRSMNGTSVDGRKVSELEIKAPCRLVFGHLSCELQSCDNETCMEHGKLPTPGAGSGVMHRPPSKAPDRPAASPNSSSRHRKSRPLSRRRRAQRKAELKLDLLQPPPTAPAGRLNSSADSFAAPRRHTGDRSFIFSPKLWALGASLLFFGAFALGYTGGGRAPQNTVAQNRSPAVSPPATERFAEKGGDLSVVAANDASLDPPAPIAAVSDVLDEEPAPNADPPPLVAPAPSVVAIQQETPATFAAPVETPKVVDSDPEPQETIAIEEAKLIASVSKTAPVFPTVPVAAAEPIAAPEPVAESPRTPEAEPAALVGSSSPAVSSTPRRPWEMADSPETQLALNDYSRLVAPWSFEAGAAHMGLGTFGSIFHRPSTAKVPTPVEPPVAQQPLSVMILGDSLALCGFGSRLDHRFRESANVRSTNTYMACGTVPMSWMKEAPYSNLKTYCGLWTIEDPVAGNKKPASFQDTYGMGKGKPKAYPVPKLEDLVAKAAPEVLILQTGTNLFSLFRDGKTVQPEHHIPMLRNQIQPFLAKILKMPHPPRAIYWVASPTSGRVSTEVQDFVLQQVTAMVGPMAKVIDSRPLVTFPYKHMEPDREHFIGADMDLWADRVFDIVQRDLADHPLPLALARPPGLPAEKPAPAIVKTGSPVGAKDPTTVRLTAKLVGKSKPMGREELNVYPESLVTFVYEVQKVTEGEYADSKIVVMHPAHIGKVTQPLDKLRIGKSYDLSVHQLEGSPWFTIKSRDDFGLNDLLPYIQLADESRFPGRQP